MIRSASILCAAPEKKEHFGIIYAEALAAGTPPVAYSGGGVSSVVSPESGMLTERNSAALGNAVRGLLEDPERLRLTFRFSKSKKCHPRPRLGDRVSFSLVRDVVKKFENRSGLRKIQRGESWGFSVSENSGRSKPPTNRRLRIW